MARPHIAAEPGHIASDVLMPGEPKRARLITDEFRNDAEFVCDVRAISCYTDMATIALGALR